MNSTDNTDAVHFESYLEKLGMKCQHRESSTGFGDKVAQFGNAEILLRIGSDRGMWFVDIADTNKPDENNWYDPAILRDVLIGPGSDVLSLAEMIEFIKKNYQLIIKAFSSAQRAETHERLNIMRTERLRRRFPGFLPNSQGNERE